jgi:hypothetical protein
MSAMTEPAESDRVAKPAPPPSFWEDVIDIFFSPAAVFRRRRGKSVWPPMLFVAIASAIIFYGTFNTLEPLFEAEFTRAMSAQAATRKMPPEALARAREFGLTWTKYGIGLIMLVTMFVIGAVTWLVSKMAGAAESFHDALVIAAWAYMPRVIGAVLGGVQGLIMNPDDLKGQLSISIGPARFFDPDTTNPLIYQMLGRFDLITIWVTVLLAVGIYVLGKVSKPRAAMIGFLMWLVGSLPFIRNAYLAM